MGNDEKPGAGTTEPGKTLATGDGAGEGKTPDGKGADDKGGAAKPGETETKTDAGKTQGQGDTAGGKADAETAPKAPDKYDLKIPEGSGLDAEDLKQIEAYARTQNWTNEQAQAAAQSHADALTAQSERFLEQTKADPTYGGAKLADTQRLALRALDKLRPKGTPRGDAFRRLLDRSGYGNNLEVIGLLADIGKAMAEDAPAVGVEKTDDETLSVADRIYGKPKPKA